MEVVDPKTVILIKDSLMFSASVLTTWIQKVFVSAIVTGKEVVCFCMCMYMTVCDISLQEQERLNLGSYFCKYMTHYSYLILAV